MKHGKEAELTPEQLDTWASHHRSCQLCGISESEAARRLFPGKLDIHHICGGANRRNYQWNLLRLCSRCHGQNHSGGFRWFNGEHMPEVNLGVILAAKRRSGDWEPEKLKELRGRGLPDLTEEAELVKYLNR